MSAAKEERETGRGSFWGKYGQPLALAVLAVYLLLLATGVVAEVFDIQPILDWWIWRPPGK